MEKETENKTEEKTEMKGTAAWFSEGKGYGFIIGEDGNQYFVHFTEIKMDKDFKMLYEGEKVEFKPAKDDQGRSKAINVRKIIKNPKRS